MGPTKSLTFGRGPKFCHATVDGSEMWQAQVKFPDPKHPSKKSIIQAPSHRFQKIPLKTSTTYIKRISQQKQSPINNIYTKKNQKKTKSMQEIVILSSNKNSIHTQDGPLYQL